MIHNYRRYLWANIFLFAFCLMIDRITKCWALFRCVDAYVVNHYLSCELTFNRGISWSLFDSETTWVFLLVSAVIAAVIVGFIHMTYQQYQEKKSLLGSALVLAGALGNFADRLIYGGVIDFISIGSWPIFNVADALICCGLAIMILGYRE